MSSSADRQARQEAYEELVAATEALGLPSEFGHVMAGELRGEKSMRRMATYLRQAKPRSVEEIVDEMLAICQMRDVWIEHERSEQAQASVTAYLNRPREANDPAGAEGQGQGQSQHQSSDV